MIKITPTPTKLEQNLLHIDAPLSLVENCVKTAIINLNDSFNRFWSLPDDEIEEILQFHGLEEITKIFTAHYTYATAFNKLLEDRGITEPRAVTTKPREIEVVDGILKLVPLPVIKQPEIIQPEITEPVIEEPIISEN